VGLIINGSQRAREHRSTFPTKIGGAKVMLKLAKSAQTSAICKPRAAGRLPPLKRGQRSGGQSAGPGGT